MAMAWKMSCRREKDSSASPAERWPLERQTWPRWRSDCRAKPVGLADLVPFRPEGQGQVQAATSHWWAASSSPRSSAPPREKGTSPHCHLCAKAWMSASPVGLDIDEGQDARCAIT
jgi:hypothetical protein